MRNIADEQIRINKKANDRWLKEKKKTSSMVDRENKTAYRASVAIDEYKRSNGRKAS
jgi:hypothetical protein